jgi:tRNA A37 methylthiotransferase MiaB
MIYVGVYSPRPNTLAWKTLQDNVPRKIKQARWKKLNDLLYKISYENNQKEI